MNDATAHVEALLEGSASQELKEVPANRQLYANSALSGSPIEQDYEESPDVLFNDRPPNLAIQHEKPEHRLLIFLKAQGLSNTEIAKRTGKTIAWVGQVLRQPWARLRLVQELKEAGQDAVQQLISASGEDSVLTLIEVRDDEKTSPAVKIAAANSLLDRLLGKPTQHVESEVTHRSLSDIEALERELAKVEAEEKRLMGRN